MASNSRARVIVVDRRDVSKHDLCLDHILKDHKIDTEDVVCLLIRTCRVCKSTGADMKVCGRCHLAAYCSKTHQRQDWPEHKRTCKEESVNPNAIH
jgi:hypothetical protein